MTRYGFAALTLLFIAPATGCALFGGNKDTQSVKDWQNDSKTNIAAKTPEAEQKLQAKLVRDRERLEESLQKHLERAELSDDVILGTGTFNDSYEPDTFENQINLLRKYDLVRELETPENRLRGKFYKDGDPAAAKRLQKLYKQKELLDDIRVAFANTEGVGLYIIAEQRDNIRLNWSVELFALQYAAEIRSFENMLETKVSDATLQEMAAVMAIRDQTRALMVTHTAMLAAFEGIASGGDPKAVTELAKASKSQVNHKSDIGLKDAKAYVKSLSGESIDMAAALEVSMRAAVGDEEYERYYQGDLVRTLKTAEEAEAQESLYDQIDDVARAAKVKEFQQKARTVQDRLTERAKQFAGGKARKFIEALPYGKQALAGLDAVRELRNGNPEAAIDMAIDAAPAGPIQSGLTIAKKLGFAAAGARKRRRRRG